MDRVLGILEVSQKQAYIFSSNALKDNIANSDTIARITHETFISETVGDEALFRIPDNVVYAGGGHTVLEFPAVENANKVISLVTERVIREYPDIELFAAVKEYEDETTAGDGTVKKVSPAENVRKLKEKLEHKKAIRQASFRQGTFGIEMLNRNNGKAELDEADFSSVERKNREVRERVNKKCIDEKLAKGQIDAAEYLRQYHVPGDYEAVLEFGNLGGRKNEVNFIAVVHIDGNGMGKRIEEFANQFETWEAYKKGMYDYSRKIAEDFTGTYDRMVLKIAKYLKTDDAEQNLALKTGKNRRRYFPVRKIITEGDDICFVSEGRIGIECARIFIDELPEEYTACAGVALVHQKYPFYRAYELAEELCSSAKKFNAGINPEDNGAALSTIDWHVEFGELKDTLEETRESYKINAETRLEMRPYIIKAKKGKEELMKREPLRQYSIFRKLMKKVLKDQEFYASGALKELRFALKRGEKAAAYYLKYHNMEHLMIDSYQDVYKVLDYGKTEIGSGKELEGKLFLEIQDGIKRSTVFDAIEIMDTYLLVEEDDHED